MCHLVAVREPASVTKVKLTLQKNRSETGNAAGPVRKKTRAGKKMWGKKIKRSFVL
jgi:hypothetical protein